MTPAARHWWGRHRRQALRALATAAVAAVAALSALPGTAAETAVDTAARTSTNTAANTAAGTPAIFRDADLALGTQLLAEHRCAECHSRKLGGDGSAIYRPLGRISTPGALRGMVQQCSTELNLQLFPEEVTAVAAVLNRDHYRFRGP